MKLAGTEGKGVREEDRGHAGRWESYLNSG